MKFLKFNKSANVEKFHISAPIYDENDNRKVEKKFTFTKDGKEPYQEDSKNLFTMNSVDKITKEIEVKTT